MIGEPTVAPEARAPADTTTPADAGSSVRDALTAAMQQHDSTDASPPEPAGRGAPEIRAQDAERGESARTPRAQLSPPSARRDAAADRGPDVNSTSANEAAGAARQDDLFTPLRQAVEKAKPYLDSLGATPEQAFQVLLSADYTLRHGTPEQKAAAVRRILEDYKIALPAQAESDAETPDDEWELPEVKALRKDIAAVKDENAQLRQHFASQQERRAIDEIKAFEAKSPHFGAVVEDMIRLAHAERAAGRQPDLAKLYETAIWTNEKTRAQLIAEQTKPKPTAAPPPPRRSPRAVAAAIEAGGSLRDTLARALAQHGGR